MLHFKTIIETRMNNLLAVILTYGINKEEFLKREKFSHFTSKQKNEACGLLYSIKMDSEIRDHLRCVAHTYFINKKWLKAINEAISRGDISGRYLVVTQDRNLVP